MSIPLLVEYYSEMPERRLKEEASSWRARLQAATDTFRQRVEGRYTEGTLLRLLESPSSQARQAALTALGLLNVAVLLGTPADRVVHPVGVRARLFARLTRVSRPGAIALVGALFAISVDTLSQAALFAITANQLLSHTAGIRDEAPMYGSHDDGALGYGETDALENVQSFEMVSNIVNLQERRHELSCAVRRCAE